MKPHLQSYLLWKQNLHIVPDLTMTKWGAFNNSSIQRQYNAYRQALADYLPKKAPDDVLEAMVDAGCRSEWAQSIYQDMRKQMMDKTRSTKLTNGEKNHE